MKGNEARVVFFLHPVDQLKDGQLSKVKPLRSSFGIRFLLLLGLVLTIGVLVFVFLQLGVGTGSQPEQVPTTEVSSDTTESPERSIKVRRNQTRGNDSTTQIDAPKETTLPGMNKLLSKFKRT